MRTSFCKTRLFLASLTLFTSTALAADFSGPVVSVIDGDTLDVLHNGQAERIRLNGIDAPEKGQPYGKKAKQFLSDLVGGKTVTVESHKLDRHRRTVADVLLPDGTNVSRELLKAGFAWWYKQYSKDETLGALEQEAREGKRGLWAGANPLPPWVYRHPELAAQEGLEADTLANVKGVPAATPQAEGPIIGNKNSHVYHRPDCPNYTATAPKNRRVFNSKEEAEKAGYQLAGNCP